MTCFEPGECVRSEYLQGPARHGRRKENTFMGGGDAEAGGAADAPPPARQTGWGMEGDGAAAPDPFAERAPPVPKAGRRLGGQDSFANGEPQDDNGDGPTRRRHDDDEINGVMEIPDLDGGFDDEEEFQRQVAAPPKARQNRVQSINELDKTVQYALPHSKDEIDLSLLISALCPMEKVKEEDEVWEPESLLSNVAFEIQSEKEQMEDKEEEAAGGAADTTKFAEEQSLFTM
mmetsp:Transcript_25315/g.48029  ORF Transcript_25315/g.48029 Transcript_25315/m.48029 type:complete len:232 (+) Transcript_25315:436-1131(+)